MVGAMPFFMNVKVVIASSARRPLIAFSTRRAFCGDTRINRASALNSIAVLSLSRRLCRGLCGRLHRVSLERTGHRELAEFVADHVFRHIDRDKLLAVMYGNRMT